MNDLITILKLIYNDYEEGNIKWIVDNLEIEGKISEDILRSIIKLD